MPIRPILTLDNPRDKQRLRRKSIRVKKVDDGIQTLIDDMIETMRSAEGIGLAAPQVGVLLRVVIAEYFDEEEDDLNQTVLINPEITEKQGEWMAEEGCLSIPGYVGTVPRAEHISVKGKDRHGKAVRLKTDGILAHILQHEIDHLDGVLYVDYLKSEEELRKVEPAERRRRRRRRRPAAEADDAGGEAEAEAPESSL